MKIAVCGKGGVGKTTISGLLCRILGAKGIPVLAIDGDPNPNLALTLGLDPQAAMPKPLTSKLLEIYQKDDGKKCAKLKSPLAEVMAEHGIQVAENVTLLAVGQPEHAGTGCMCGTHTTVREIIHTALEESEQVTLLDLEASLEQMKRGTSKYVDVLLCVVEPYYRSMEAVARFQRLGKELEIKNIVAVANKVKNAQDEEAIRDFCAQTDLPVIAVIPLDPTVSEADKKGSLDMADIDESPALRAINQLAEDLLETV
ncbi:AAA family ATPase [Persicitalea sp.]|uniref:ATP-binding protein n=1 Tax=Persicitalea sp. TaxID=3100273 RepID=UPI003592F5D9